MALVVYDQGYRIQTPVRFRQRGVEAMTASRRLGGGTSRSPEQPGAREHPPGTDQDAARPHKEAPAESPALRHARQAYSQTARISEPEQRSEIPVAKIMTAPVFSIRRGASMTRAWQEMQEHGVHQLPVVDDRGLLFGMLSDRDLLLRTSPLAQRGPVKQGSSIEGCYPTQLVIATADTEARLVALVMLEKHTNAVPVLSERGVLSGIVTRSDLIHVVANDPDFENWA